MGLRLKAILVINISLFAVDTAQKEEYLLFPMGQLECTISGSTCKCQLENVLHFILRLMMTRYAKREGTGEKDTSTATCSAVAHLSDGN